MTAERENRFPETETFWRMFITSCRFCHTKTSKQGLQVIRSMFRLKQALSSWNYRFDVIIMVYDLIQNENDSCVYEEVSGSALTIMSYK